MSLPCVKSLRRHLLAVEIGYGFDKHFLKLLKKRCNNKTEYQKKVIIVFDEIFLRESLFVNTRSLMYQGLEDFGVDFDCRTFEKANHSFDDIGFS